jgi:hypothetical protein
VGCHHLLIAAGSKLSTAINLLPKVRVAGFHLPTNVLEKKASHPESAAEIFIIVSTIGTAKVVIM